MPYIVFSIIHAGKAAEPVFFERFGVVITLNERQVFHLFTQHYPLINYYIEKQLLLSYGTFFVKTW
jgi:hypothetical protein